MPTSLLDRASSSAESQTVARGSRVLAGGAVVVGLVAALLVLIHNRYIPITEGWFSAYADLLHQGKVPYRDFYLFCQPIPLFIAQMVTSISEKLIYVRYYSLIERCLLTAALYYILSRSFSVPASCIAALVSTICFITYYTDAFFSYLYTCLLLVLLATTCLQAAYLHPARRRLFMILSGCFASLSFFCKQSAGLLETGAGLVSILLLSRDVRQACRDVFHAAAGWLVCALPFLAWISYHQVWPQYLQQVFVGAANSKGSLLTVFFGFYQRLFDPITMNAVVAGILLTAWFAYEKKISIRLDRGPDPVDMRWLAVFGVLAIAAVFVPAIHRLTDLHAYWLAEINSRVIKLALCWLMALLCWILWRRLSGREMLAAPVDETVVILAVTSFFWSYASGMSSTIEAQTAIPSLGLLIAIAYDRFSFRRPHLMRGLVAATSFFILIICAAQKYTIAFSWTGWREAVSQAGVRSHWNGLAGYTADAGTIGTFDSILDDIYTHSSRGDTIFSFPHMPMFNYLSGRPQPTFALVHYWDVCPDSVAIEDAERVRASRPKMIVNMEFTEDVWEYHERSFRMGRRSGQRQIQKVIDELTSSGDYRLLNTHEARFFHFKIRVWNRER